MTIPAFFSFIINTIVSLYYWQDIGSIDITKLNHPMMFWTGIVGMLSMALFLTTILGFSKYSNNIDKLEELKVSYIKSIEEMEKVRDEYTKLLKNK